MYDTAELLEYGGFYRKGDIVGEVSTDRHADAMYFILEGEVEVSVNLQKNNLTDKDLKLLEQDLQLNKQESMALT